MERAPLSTTRNTERTRLIAARHACHFSQDEVAAKLQVNKVTVYRWEKEGDVPQPLHLRELCTLYGKTAQELGFTAQELLFEEEGVAVHTGNETEDEGAEQESVLATFRQRHILSRLMRIVWNWPPGDARYQMLQSLILLELEDNAVNDDMSRRDALRFLALVPIDLLGLSQLGAVFKKEFSYEDILKHCAAGITACWQLRMGKELAFADQAVSTYIPTLKAMVQTAPGTQRRAAADLLAQSLLLKSVLSCHLTTPNDAIASAQQAESYSTVAESRLLRITALRRQAAAFCHANQWGQALQAAEKAKSLLEERDKQNQQRHASASSQPVEEPISQIVQSYVYAGLATYQAYHRRKEDAQFSLQKAHTTFFAQPGTEVVPLWINHSVGNLLLNDGVTHMHLGLYKSALDSFEQIDARYAQDATIPMSLRAESTFDLVMAEVNRDDQPRRMDWCINEWKKGMEGVRELKSQKRFDEALQAYIAMCAAWPGEKQVRDLREYIVHW